MPKITIVLNGLLVAVPLLAVLLVLWIRSFNVLTNRTEALMGGMREDEALDPDDKRALRALSLARFGHIFWSIVTIASWVGVAWWLAPHKREVVLFFKRWIAQLAGS